MTPLPDDVRDLFERPNFVHLATLLPSGAPHSVPVWVAIEGEHLCFFTQEGSRKARNVQGDPRVAMSVVDRENPYRMAQVRGRVVDTRHGEDALEVMDRMAMLHTGRPFPIRAGVLFLVEVERVQNTTLPFADRPTVP
jgi:PPOX class probable F420-dependent enzyme